MPNHEPPADSRQIGLEETRQARIEAHHAISPAVTVKIPAKGRDPAPEIAVDLDLEQQRDAAGDQAQQAAKRRDWPLSHSKPAKLSVGRCADSQWARAYPPGVGIVENEDPIVCGQPQVAFDAGPDLEGGGDGKQAVFGETGAIVQAAVCEPRWAGIERVRL